MILSSTTSEGLIEKFIAFRLVLAESPVVRTFENRVRFIEQMNTCLPEWKRSGAWTKDVGVEYGKVLREFTKLKNILRTMHSGILLPPVNR